MNSLREILKAAHLLPSEDRAKLIVALWDDLSPNDWIRPSDEWIEEANRRSVAFDAGKMTGAPWSEVRERARGEAGLNA
jgi:putative addiction module component (TIGR02574 family)